MVGSLARQIVKEYCITGDRWDGDNPWHSVA